MKRIFLRVMMRATHIYCFKCLVGRARCPPRPISMHWVGSYGQVAALYFNINSFSARGDAKPALGKGVPFLARSFRFATQTHQLPRPCLRIQPQLQPQPQIQPNLKFNMTPLPFPSTSTSKLTSFSTSTIQGDIPQLMCAEKDAKCQIILSDITQAC